MLTLPQRSIMMGGMTLLMSVKRNSKDCRLKRALSMVNVRMVADAVLLIKTCAESCDAGMANLDACVMYIMPFVVHRVTWEAWPYKQGRYASCPPISWGGCRRECRPIGGRKRACSQAGVLTKVCRSMFAAVLYYAEPKTKHSMSLSDDAWRTQSDQ